MHCWALIQAFFYVERRKKSFLLNLIIAGAEQGFEVFLSIAEKQQQEHGGNAKMSKDENF